MVVDPFTMAIIISAGSALAGEIAGAFVEVTDPLDLYKENYGPMVTNTPVPGFLLPDEIRSLTYAGSKSTGTAEVNRMAANMAKGRKPSVHARYDAMQRDAGVARTVRAVNTKLRTQEAGRQFKQTGATAGVFAQNAIMAQMFKNNMADAAAAKAMYKHSQQVEKREAVTSIVSKGAGLAGMAATVPDVRNWFAGVFSREAEDIMDDSAEDDGDIIGAPMDDSTGDDWIPNVRIT